MTKKKTSLQNTNFFKVLRLPNNVTRDMKNEQKTTVKNLSYTGIYQYDCTLKNILKDCEKLNVQEITNKFLISYFKTELEQKRKYSKALLKRYKYSILKGLETYYVSQNDFKRLGEIREVFRLLRYTPKPLIAHKFELPSMKEIAKVLAKASTSEFVIICFIFLSGLRNKELRNIKLVNCKIFKSKVVITIDGKGKNQRKIPIPVFLYKMARSTFSGKFYLFENEKGKQLHSNTVCYLVSEAGKRVNLELKPHLIRKAIINHIRKTYPRVSQETLCELFGHSRSVQDMYYRLYDNRQIKFHSHLSSALMSEIKKLRGKKVA